MLYYNEILYYYIVNLVLQTIMFLPFNVPGCFLQIPSYSSFFTLQFKCVYIYIYRSIHIEQPIYLHFTKLHFLPQYINKWLPLISLILHPLLSLAHGTFYFSLQVLNFLLLSFIFLDFPGGFCISWFNSLLFACFISLCLCLSEIFIHVC